MELQDFRGKMTMVLKSRLMAADIVRIKGDLPPFLLKILEIYRSRTLCKVAPKRRSSIRTRT
jgi:hypothetical protein